MSKFCKVLTWFFLRQIKIFQSKEDNYWLVEWIKQDIILRQRIFGRLSLALEKHCVISVILLLFSIFISIVSSLVFVFSSVFSFHFLATEFKLLFLLILVSSTSNQQWLQLLWSTTPTEGREKVIHFPFHQEKVKDRQSRKFSVRFPLTFDLILYPSHGVSNPSFVSADLSHRWS